MNRDELRAMQAPLKTRYRDEPDAAVYKLRAHGKVEQPKVACAVSHHETPRTAGLHPATGGDGSLLCSGDMLLEALVACSGVTLAAVATAMGIELRSADVRAEGVLDFRGTLGVAKDAPVGFTDITLTFDLDSDASDDQLDTLLRLTERYCVVYQTLASPPSLHVKRTERAEAQR
jgi:uncharacterized OsmC-like protein